MISFSKFLTRLKSKNDRKPRRADATTTMGEYDLTLDVESIAPGISVMYGKAFKGSKLVAKVVFLSAPTDPKGKTLYLEDQYELNEVRGKGVAKALIKFAHEKQLGFNFTDKTFDASELKAKLK